MGLVLSGLSPVTVSEAGRVMQSARRVLSTSPPITAASTSPQEHYDFCRMQNIPSINPKPEGGVM